jgi:hypothetical protein
VGLKQLVLLVMVATARKPRKKGVETTSKNERVTRPRKKGSF